MITPLVIVMSLIIIMYFGYFLINMLFPFIWQQKLDSISKKYMFVIEKYGYLTKSEEDSLISELKEQGFKTEKINIIAPRQKKAYGEMLEFCIEYKCEMNFITGMFSINKKDILINVRKTSFCKR